MAGEKYGADVFWVAQGKTWGVQRKTVSDFVGSVRDERLGEQVRKMGELDHKVLMIEGRPAWTRDDELILPWGRFKRTQYVSVLWAARYNWEVELEFTDNLDETVKRVKWLEAWSKKENHASLSRSRVNMRLDPEAKSSWGEGGNREFQVHILTSFPGVGRQMALRIIDHFDGPAIGWRVNMESLMGVKGVGKVMAQRLIDGLK